MSEPDESITILGQHLTSEELAALFDAAGGNVFLAQEAIASVALSRDDRAQTHSIPSESREDVP